MQTHACESDRHSVFALQLGGIMGGVVAPQDAEDSLERQIGLNGAFQRRRFASGRTAAALVSEHLMEGYFALQLEPLCHGVHVQVFLHAS